MGCKLFRDMCAENNQLLHLCEKDIISAAETMVKLETKYIDKMFEMGDVEGIKANDLKHFIKKRANEKLMELGYKNLGSYFPYDEVAAGNLDWFYHLTGGHRSIQEDYIRGIFIAMGNTPRRIPTSRNNSRKKIVQTRTK